MDIAVILDGSQSLSEENFEKLKNFTKSIVEKYGVSKSGPHIAVVEFSKEPAIAIKLDDHFETANLKMAIDNIKPSGNLQVKTDEALRVVVNDVFSSEAGGRSSVPKIVILVTDDESTGDRPLEEMKADTEGQGARIFVVAIGTSVDRDDLKKLIPKDDYIVSVPDVDDLDNITSHIVDAIKTDTKERKYARLILQLFIGQNPELELL